ncbi:MAG: OmpA family protein [Flavobacteriales bacterium]|nr:OmpA family protein [Flavobacteriales bacterium]
MLLLACMLLAMRPSAVAQLDATLYHMSTIPQVRYTNPAQGSDYTWYIGLPVISSIYANVHHNGFVTADLLRKRADDSVYFDMDNVINQLGDKNLFGFNLQVDILALGFTKGDNEFFFNVTEKAMARIRYPKDLMVLIWEGNGAFIDKTIDLSGSALRLTEYREYAFGMSRKFSDNLTIGAKAKVLGGFINFSTIVSKLELYTAPSTFELSGSSDLVINSSMDTTGEFPNNFFSLENFGLGLDVGATYKLSDKITVSGSIIDLGYIKWKRDAKNISNDLDGVTFRGNAINTFTDSSSAPFEEIGDSLQLTFDNQQTTSNAYKDGLIPRIYLGGKYQLNENNNAGLLFHGEYFKGSFYPSLTLSYNYKLPRWVGASVSYSIMNGSFFNLGLGLSLNLGPVQIYVVSDNVGGMFNMTSINNKNAPDSVSKYNIIVPYKAKTLHVRTGIGLTFKKFEKDKDKDGIIDKEDECPDTPGPKELNGCPDRDGDGTIDKYDECPDEPGLPENEGCPDRDNDKVIDKEDECPDIPGVPENKGCPVTLNLLDSKNNELIAGEINEDGFFVFENLPKQDSYLFKLNADDVDLIEEVQILQTLDGKETILTAFKNEDGMFEFEQVEERRQILYLIDYKGDTLQQTEINRDGFFIFSNLPANQSHLFLLDPGSTDLLDDLIIMLVDADGNEKVIRAQRTGDNAFEYAYIPPKQVDLDLLEEEEVPVILLEEEKEIINTAFDNLEFNVGSDVIRFGSYKALESLSELLMGKPDWKIKLSGYTDNIGSANLNLVLSKKRAEAVKRALLNKGVPADRIIVRYYGESQPIASNETKEGQQTNRRVEMLIVQSGIVDDDSSAEQKTEEPLASSQKGVVFKVQLLAASLPVYLTPVNFKGLENVEEYKHAGLFKYVVGSSDRYDYASAVLLTQIKKQGYKGAFIVAFKNGKRIPVTDEMKLPKD